MNTFENLARPELVRALKENGIVEPTTIQQKTIPLITSGKDVVGTSRTGSGKTASFGIPLLEKVQKGQGVQGLVLAPTRELANQISNELRKWGKYLNINVATVFGGVAIHPQTNQIARSEIVVGTPGRIIDHLSRGSLDLSRLTGFVLDEADKMVEMGFIEDIERVLSATPSNRQIILFGATLSSEVDYLKGKYMNDVVMAEAELHVEKDLLEQYYYNVKTHEKFSLLVHLLKKEDTKRVIIFCSKRSTVELVQKNLRKQGVKAEMIHGKMSQNRRLQVIDGFNKGKSSYLVASAVAARGLDIKDVSHVFNYDLANDPQEYVHRVGRTARAGESGKAITLLSAQDHGSFHAIFSRYNIEAEELPAENFQKLRFETIRRDSFRGSGFRGGHGSQRNGGFRGGHGGQRNGGFRGRDSNRGNGYASKPARREGGYGRPGWNSN